MACCGDVPTLETLAAVDLLRRHVPEIKVRVVNVVDLMTLQPRAGAPSGLSDRDFDVLFTRDRPVVFAFHGYPWLDPPADVPANQPRELPCPRLQGRRDDDDPVRHVRVEWDGPFHLVGEVIDRVPKLWRHAPATPSRRFATRSSITGSTSPRTARTIREL